MPFTPFHLGAGTLLKALQPRRLSWVMFAVSQVAMDLEPLYRLLRGDLEVHGFSHTALGATVVGLACLPLRVFADRFVPITWPAAAVGVATGVYSHLLLDGFLHGDMHLPWLGWASWAQVEAACGLMGLVGGARLWRQKVIQEAWAELRRRSPWG